MLVVTDLILKSISKFIPWFVFPVRLRRNIAQEFPAHVVKGRQNLHVQVFQLGNVPVLIQWIHDQAPDCHVGRVLHSRLSE